MIVNPQRYSHCLPQDIARVAQLVSKTVKSNVPSSDFGPGGQLDINAVLSVVEDFIKVGEQSGGGPNNAGAQLSGESHRSSWPTAVLAVCAATHHAIGGSRISRKYSHGTIYTRPAVTLTRCTPPLLRTAPLRLCPLFIQLCEICSV